MFTNIQYFLIKNKQTEQIFEKIAFIFLQFIKLIIYFSKLIDICINRAEQKAVDKYNVLSNDVSEYCKLNEKNCRQKI